MSCSVSSAYGLGCKGGVGGIQTLYIFSSPITGITYSGSGDTQIITQISGASASSLVEFELYRGGSNFTENMAADPASGTVVYTQTITALFRDYTAQLRNQFSLLAKSGNIQAIVKTNRNEFILCGADFGGGDATAINLASGTAYTDRQGYDVTLTFLQENPANFISIAAPYGTVDIDAVLTGFSLVVPA
jgi:hypothetical protein